MNRITVHYCFVMFSILANKRCLRPFLVYSLVPIDLCKMAAGSKSSSVSGLKTGSDRRTVKQEATDGRTEVEERTGTESEWSHVVLALTQRLFHSLHVFSSRGGKAELLSVVGLVISLQLQSSPKIAVVVIVFIIVCPLFILSSSLSPIIFYSFIHSGDLYSASSRHYYSEAHPAQSRPKKKNLRDM